MSVLMDIVGALVLVGMLIMTIMSININMSAETYKTLTEFHIHTEAIQLARIFEFDLYKAGYDVPKSGAIAVAETSRIKFTANIKNIAGASNTMEYNLGPTVPSSRNPRDRSLYRIEDGTVVYINFSVTRFKLTYYDSVNAVIPAPVTTLANRDRIKAIKVYLTLESPEPFDTVHVGGSSYVSAFYQKLIYPRNLQ